MQSFFSRTRLRHLPTVVGLLVAIFSTAFAQAPAPAPLQTLNPHYVSVPLEIAVSRPATEVWKRSRKYCDIKEWLPKSGGRSTDKHGRVMRGRSHLGGAGSEIF